MELDTIMKNRYSVRRFQNRKIEDNMIEELLSVLKYVPTAMNLQPEKVYVLKSKGALEKMGTLANTYQAPVVLLICADKNLAWKNSKEEHYDTSEMDASIAGTYLMLKAWDLGLGSVWIRFFQSKEIQIEFSLPLNIQPICLLAIGYPHEDSMPSDRHYQKKDLQELVEYQ